MTLLQQRPHHTIDLGLACSGFKKNGCNVYTSGVGTLQVFGRHIVWTVGHQVLQVAKKNLLGNEKVTKSLHTNQEPVLGEREISRFNRVEQDDNVGRVLRTHSRTRTRQVID